ncbi:MAG: PspA/IM30 family protein [Gammaproteobacteria bacterium]|nr:PspA/IM30 family protein [Gammaproteobacteria bacterium]
MALITRISRLFRADFNAVLDRIEEPDVLLKQALREMEDDVHNDEQHMKSLQNEYSQSELKIKELEENIQQVDQELDICFESDEAELARSQVKRKLEMQRYEKHLKSKLNSLDKHKKELKTRIDENKSRLIAMQQKLDLLISDDSLMNSNDSYQNISMAINKDEIEMAFLKEKQARSAS